jgi:hypothetical protein
MKSEGAPAGDSNTTFDREEKFVFFFRMDNNFPSDATPT